VKFEIEPVQDLDNKGMWQKPQPCSEELLVNDNLVVMRIRNDLSL
jgi:hypothetical protein